MKFLILLNTVLNINIVFADDSTNCGDWEQYKEEHCYKLFTGVQSYNEAKKLCQTNNSTLVVIHYAEEQNFLSNYIFTKKKTVDNVWIGAKFVGNGLFQWEDHTTVEEFSNWAPGYPKNLADHCVQMLSDEGLEGKWVDERCARKNAAVCQRMPPLSLKLLAETVVELKHSLQQIASKFTESKNELTETKNKFEKTEKTLTNKLEQTKIELEKIKNKTLIVIPIGFTYFQLPKDKAPSELWPSMTWTDISSEYEGVFFRVVGGGANSFGVVQQENVPRLETVYVSSGGDDLNKGLVNFGKNMSIPVTGWSKGYCGAGFTGACMYTYYKHTDTSEVRPKNMAIKVYKRTA